MLINSKYGKQKKLIFKTPYFINSIIYILVVLFFGTVVSYYSYILERSKLLSTNDKVLNDIFTIYNEKFDNFWSIYMPAFKNIDYSKVVSRFFQAESVSELNDPFLLKDLAELLMWSTLQDKDIEWIMLYRNIDQDAGYVFYPREMSFRRVKDFPYLSQIKNKNTVKKIYGTEKMVIDGESKMVYGIVGGGYVLNTDMPADSLLVAYNLEPIHQSFDSGTMYAKTQILVLTGEGSVIYDSNGTGYNKVYDFNKLQNAEGIINDWFGEKVYYKSIMNNQKDFITLYIVPWNALFIAANKNTPMIMMVVIMFMLLTSILYGIAGHSIMQRINIISKGLAEIGNNNLSYKIPFEDSSDEFGAITHSINEMATQLNDNIQKMYVYQLKQKSAELAELQARINPHFLYNTLEVIRGKLYEKGDIESSEMLVNLSSIFRNFVAGKQFITIREELSLCNIYMELLKIRYGESVSVIYDVDSVILDYGIIRNLLQPLIENYFIHGFCPNNNESYITITGKLLDNKFIEIVVSDNGKGITPERLSLIEAELSSGTDSDSNNCYGLKNLKDRISLFYGCECSLKLTSNSDGGVTARIIIYKLTCKEHESRISH